MKRLGTNWASSQAGFFSSFLFFILVRLGIRVFRIANHETSTAGISPRESATVRPRTFGKLAVAVLMISTVVSHAQESKAPLSFPDFTAVQLIGTKRRSLPMKVYWSGAGVRIETTLALADLFPAATDNLYRLTVYPDKTLQCIVMRTEQTKMMPSPLELLQGIKVKRTAAGTETVEGHSCTVEQVSVTRADGRTIESKVWEADDLKGVPIKIETQLDDQKVTAIYRDIELGALGKEIFTPPNKCIPYEKMAQIVENKIVK